jgi:hypothetical protein
MDMNKHIISGLVQELQRLGLVEATNKVSQDEEPYTFVFGRSPIDIVYHTPDLEVAGVTLLSFHKSMGNHCTILVDITTCSAISLQEHKIVCPSARCLTNKNNQSVKKYLDDVTEQFRQHKISEQHDNLISAVEEGPLNPDLMEQIERINSLKTEIQKGSKHRCRKIIKPLLPFSKPVRSSDKQCQAYVNLKTWHKGKSTNSHIIRAARRAGIQSPRTLPAAQCAAGAAACRRHLKEHELVAKNLRRVHLHNRYKLASNLKDSHKKQEIMQVIRREEQKDDWNQIQHTMGEPRLGATPKVQRIENSEVIDIVIASEMNREVQIVMEQQFNLAKSAPIQSSSLRDSLGFLFGNGLFPPVTSGQIKHSHGCGRDDGTFNLGNSAPVGPAA